MLSAFFIAAALLILQSLADNSKDEDLVKKFEEEYALPKILSTRNYYDDYTLIHPAIKKTSEACAVFKARKKRLPESFAAIKKIDLKMVNAKHISRAEREARLLKFLKHERIVEGLGVYKAHGYLFIATEWLDYGTLHQFTVKEKNNKIMPPKIAIGFMRQIAQGIEYLHRFNIAHRDVKPENMMFGRCAKIIDLGLCTKMKANDELRGSVCGTPIFIPMEVHVHKRFRTNIDIYALGLSFMLLLFDPMPGAENMGYEAFKERLVENLGPWCPELRVPTTDPFHILLRSCIAANPDDRPTASMVLRILEDLDGADDETLELFITSIK